MNLCFATKQERSNPLPGDSIVDAPEISSTHAISIHVDPPKVWPWIIQIGQDRGGFYSYTLLENLLGCQMTNAIEINPEWQNLSVGDVVPLHPKFPPMLVQALGVEKSYRANTTIQLSVELGICLGCDPTQSNAFVGPHANQNESVVDDGRALPHHDCRALCNGAPDVDRYQD